jgi:hypothetical protein
MPPHNQRDLGTYSTWSLGVCMAYPAPVKGSWGLSRTLTPIAVDSGRYRYDQGSASDDGVEFAGVGATFYGDAQCTRSCHYGPQ